MSSPNRVVIVFALAWLCGCSSQPSTMDAAMPRDTAALRILVFTRTAGFHHDSIPAGVATLRELASADGIAVDHTEDATRFDAQTLANYHAVVFLSTTRDVLDVAQQAAFERYVAGGGAWLGVHAAADTEYDWPWYGELAGAWFAGHPPGLQTARVRFEASHAGLADGGASPTSCTTTGATRA